VGQCAAAWPRNILTDMKIVEQGDIIWMDFDPAAGHEQSGARPALVVSSSSYNQLSGMAIVCPMTTRKKNRRFEVVLQKAGKFSQGVVLADQLKNVDLTARSARHAGKAAAADIDMVLGVIAAVLNIQVA
jgi:mRNA interferase MazF